MTVPDRADRDLGNEDAWNRSMIAEFRAHRGRLSGPLDGAPVLLLHHVGARTGVSRVNPVLYQQVGGSYAVFASAAGRARHPGWFHNVRAHPETVIEIGDDQGVCTVAVRARVADPEQRAPIWRAQVERYPGFADYERTAGRVIPVVILDHM